MVNWSGPKLSGREARSSGAKSSRARLPTLSASLFVSAIAAAVRVIWTATKRARR